MQKDTSRMNLCKFLLICLICSVESFTSEDHGPSREHERPPSVSSLHRQLQSVPGPNGWCEWILANGPFQSSFNRQWWDSKFLKICESKLWKDMLRMLVCDSDSNPKRPWKKSTNWPRNSMSSRKKQTHFTTVLSPCECPATTMGRSPVSNRNCSKALRMSWNATSQLPPMPASMVRHQICQIASKYYSQK